MEPKIRERVLAIEPKLTEFRHDIHQHPERGFREVPNLTRTQQKVKEMLLSMGIKEEDIKITAKTGLVVDIKGTAKSEVKGTVKKIALRADMDALGMTEENHSLPYRSENNGVAHMCGHDGHMASLLGLAWIVQENRDKIPEGQSVRLLFQPAEEGPGGAHQMIEEGCLEGVDECYGMHNWPRETFGELATVPGPFMAHVTEFEVTITGKGGHGSQPHATIDPVICAAHLVTALQTIVSRNMPYSESVVLSVTQIHAGEAFNVIPTTAMIGGTIRDLNPEIFEIISKRIQTIVENTCNAFGCTGKLRLDSMYPAVLNHAEQAGHVLRVAKENGFKTSNKDLPVLASEDFSYFLQKVPGCFFFLSGGPGPILHSNRYNWNDALTPLAVEFWVKLVEDRLQVQLQ